MQFGFSRLRPIVSILPLVLLAAAVTALVLWPRSDDQPIASGDWTCSMHPQVRMPKPGKCPICGMPLVPVSQLKSLEDRAGVETELVTRRELFKEIRTVGKVDYNESQVAYISARIDGRVDRLYVDFTGVDVESGDHLVDIYSPSLVVAQEELLRALDAYERQRPTGTGVSDQFLQANLESAREKLHLWGILPEQVAEFEKTRKPRVHVTLYAPISGTVIEKEVRAGQYVKEGDLLYRIAELNPIWLYLEIYEFDITWVRYGQSVDVTLEAMPGETFRGMVTFIDPFLDESTRTVKVRVNLPNDDRRLKPGMYASASVRVRLSADGSAAATGLEGKFVCPMHPEVIQDQPGKCNICEMELKQVPQRGPFSQMSQSSVPSQVAQEGHADHKPPSESIPTPSSALSTAPSSLPLAVRGSAVLDTGRRTIAYRARDDGAYEIVRLAVGTRAVGSDDNGQSVVYLPVLEGLQENDRVVVRAGFLLDSQRQIEGMPSLFFPEGAAPAAGHSEHGGRQGSDSTSTEQKGGASDMDKMRSELQKLSPDDRASAERQHICPVTGKMLGTMGAPQKVEVRGQEVWLCCPDCKDEVLSHADKYLAKLRMQ